MVRNSTGSSGSIVVERHPDTEEESSLGLSAPSVESESSSREQAATRQSDVDDDAGDDATSTPKSPRRRRSVSISLRSLLTGMSIAVLVCAVAAVGWLYLGAEKKLDAIASASANDARAEKISLEYAVSAATMDFNDLQAWKVKLVAGTAPELNDKLTKAAVSMEQILKPLQWVSTAKPLVAKVRSDAAGVYVVDCFVSVQTKTVQAPDPLQSTATYSLTIDSDHDWQITDVGGIGSVTGAK